MWWEAEFEVVGAPAAEVEGAIRGLYQAGLDNLHQILAAAT